MDRVAGAHGSQGTEESCQPNETIIAYWYRMSMITCKWFGCCGIAAWPQAFLDPGVFYFLHISRNPEGAPLLRKRCTIGDGVLHASDDARNSV
jgi:hypothetical protein